MNLKPAEFLALTPSEFNALADGYRRRRRDQAFFLSLQLQAAGWKINAADIIPETADERRERESEERRREHKEEQKNRKTAMEALKKWREKENA